MTFVPSVTPMSYRDTERVAEKQLLAMFPERLETPGIIDVIETWELLGDTETFTASVCELPPGVEGRTWPDGRVELAETTYVSACNGDTRARFTVAHECAHAWQHAEQIKSVLESGKGLRLNRRQEIPAYCDPEWQADAIAAAYLMPRVALKKIEAAGQRLSPHVLQETFQVSYTAACKRIRIIRKYF